MLPAQVLGRVGGGVVEQGRDLLEGETELAVDQHLVQPVQVGRAYRR